MHRKLELYIVSKMATLHCTFSPFQKFKVLVHILQGHKVYVQDRLREHGQRVWQLLQLGGHFYVCGDAAYMASAVEAALLDVISSHQVLFKAEDLYSKGLQYKRSRAASENLSGPIETLLISYPFDSSDYLI